MRLDQVTVDLTKVEQGVWIDSIPGMADLRLKVRPLNNPDFQRMQDRMISTALRGSRNGKDIPFDARENIVSKCLHETVLMDWSNLDGADGPLPYSRELALDLLQKPEYRLFREAVAWAAGAADEDLRAATESDVKN